MKRKLTPEEERRFLDQFNKLFVMQIIQKRELKKKIGAMKQALKKSEAPPCRNS